MAEEIPPNLVDRVPAQSHGPDQTSLKAADNSLNSDEVDLAELWHVILKQRRLIVGMTVVTTLFAAAVSFVMTPVYRAEVLIAPVSDDGLGGMGALAGQFGGLAALAGISFPGSGDTDSAIATLASRRLVSGFIKDNNLKPVLYDDEWDQAVGTWKEPSGIAQFIKSFAPADRDSVPDEKLVPGEPSTWESTRAFLKNNLEVEQDKKTSLITVAVEWKDARLAAEWANEIVARANRELRERAIQESQRSIDYLRDQIQQTNVADLRAVLYGLVEEHTKNITIAKTNTQYAFRVIDPAVRPERRASPNRLLLIVLGMIGGLSVGAAVAILRDSINKSARTT